MPKYPVTPAPPFGSIHMGYWNLRGPLHGWRPKGTRDWLMVYTEQGNALLRFPGGEYRTRPHDIFLYQPNTAEDYGQHHPTRYWKNIWTHWLPRKEVLAWLLWPELSPGLRLLSLPAPIGRAVRRELALGQAALQGNHSLREAFATNAVDRALLLCDRANPRSGERIMHPRIEEAAEYLATHLGEVHTLEELAHRFGFSRSRFAALFRAQVGHAPMRYLEIRRLVQAQDLLRYTRQTLVQVAEHCGFACPFYLSLRFKKHFGRSPRAFRQSRDA